MRGRELTPESLVGMYCTEIAAEAIKRAIDKDREEDDFGEIKPPPTFNP